MSHPLGIQTTALHLMNAQHQAIRLFADDKTPPHPRGMSLAAAHILASYAVSAALVGGIDPLYAMQSIVNEATEIVARIEGTEEEDDG